MKLQLQQLEDAAYNLLKFAATKIPQPVYEKIKTAYLSETNPGGKSVLHSILNNIADSVRLDASICQDIGVPTFTLVLPSNVQVEGNIHSVLEEASRQATADVPLRKNTIEPFTQDNKNDNTGWKAPIFHLKYDPTLSQAKLRGELKGFGGEIKSTVDWVFTSTRSMENAVLAYVLNSVILSKGEACIPSFLGVGVGGYGSDAVYMAKDSVFRSITSEGNADPFLSKLEDRIFRVLNSTGLGPMGKGGDTTTFGVYVERMGTHTACSPVAVAHQCWASRASEAILTPDGIKYITPHVEKSDIAGISELLSKEISVSAGGKGKTYYFDTPISQEDIRKLQIGDMVYLTGTICTSRDGAHRRMVSFLQEGRQEEIPEDIRDNKILYHSGPVTAKENDEWIVTAAGPTTSSRFTKDGAVLVEKGLVNVFIGKGTLGYEAVNAMRDKAVYLNAVGGCAVCYGQCIGRTDVHWIDLGPPEAMWIMKMKNFGPLVVSIDAHGNSLSDIVMEKVCERALEIYKEEGLNPDERYAQRPITMAGMSLNEVIDHLKKN